MKVLSKRQINQFGGKQRPQPDINYTNWFTQYLLHAFYAPHPKNIAVEKHHTCSHGVSSLTTENNFLKLCNSSLISFKKYLLKTS